MRQRTATAAMSALLAAALCSALAAGVLLASGCGQTGPLTLAEPESDAESNDAEDER